MAAGAPSSAASAQLEDAELPKRQRQRRLKERRSDVSTVSGGGGAKALRRKRPAAEALSSDDEVPPPAAPAQTKRQRVLKALSSEEAEEPDVALLESFVDRVRLAAKAGQWQSESATSTSTVHFWCNQLLDALPAAASAEQGRLKLLKEKFPRFLQKLVLDSPCYASLGKVVEIFAALEKGGCPPAALVPAFSQMATCETAAKALTLTAEKISLQKRMDLFSSVLFRDFQQSRVDALLRTASMAGAAEARERALEALREFTAEMDQEAPILKEVEMAQAMFGARVPAAERVKYAILDPETRSARLKFAVTWAAAATAPNAAATAPKAAGSVAEAALKAAGSAAGSAAAALEAAAAALKAAEAEAADEAPPEKAAEAPLEAAAAPEAAAAALGDAPPQKAAEAEAAEDALREKAAEAPPGAAAALEDAERVPGRQYGLSQSSAIYPLLWRTRTSCWPPRWSQRLA